MEIMILVFVAMVYRMMPRQFFHQLKCSDYESKACQFKLTKQWLRNEGKMMWLWLRHMVQDVNESWGLLRGLHGINGTCQYDDDSNPMNSTVYELLTPNALGKNAFSVSRVSWSKGIVEYLISTIEGDKVCTIKLGKALRRQIEADEVEAAYQAWFIYENKDNPEFFSGFGSQGEFAYHGMLRRHDKLIATKRILKEFEVRDVVLNWRISADPADLFTMSHGRPWYSCQGIEGSYRAGVFADVAAGSAIMFFYRPGQSEPCGRRLVRLAIYNDQLALKLYHGYGTTGLPTKEELQKKTGVTWMVDKDEGWHLWITAPELLEYQGGYSSYLDGGHWHQTLELKRQIMKATTDLRDKINALRQKSCLLGAQLDSLIRETAFNQHILIYEAMNHLREHPLQQQIDQLCQEERDLWHQMHAMERSIETEYLEPLVLQIRLLAFQRGLTNSKIEFPIDKMAKNLIGNESFWKLRERDKFTIQYLTKHNSRSVWNHCETL